VNIGLWVICNGYDFPGMKHIFIALGANVIQELLTIAAIPENTTIGGMVGLFARARERVCVD
jgi:hypothetical protein